MNNQMTSIKNLEWASVGYLTLAWTTCQWLHHGKNRHLLGVGIRHHNQLSSIPWSMIWKRPKRLCRSVSSRQHLSALFPFSRAFQFPTPFFHDRHSMGLDGGKWCQCPVKVKHSIVTCSWYFDQLWVSELITASLIISNDILLSGSNFINFRMPARGKHEFNKLIVSVLQFIIYFSFSFLSSDSIFYSSSFVLRSSGIHGHC